LTCKYIREVISLRPSDEGTAFSKVSHHLRLAVTAGANNLDAISTTESEAELYLLLEIGNYLFSDGPTSVCVYFFLYPSLNKLPDTLVRGSDISLPSDLQRAVIYQNL
jgi:hypothetical protein